MQTGRGDGQGTDRPIPVEITPTNERRRTPQRIDSAGDAPTDGPLVDRYGRIHSDLRISVTDRCNLRCVYCMAEEGMTFLPRSEILSYEEIVRVARVAHGLGVDAIRLTGGEPLVRKGVVGLVAGLRDVGFSDIGLTTNAVLLAPLAESLKEAGLSRINVSCDSLRADRFGEIRRRGELETVLGSMDVAEAAGFRPLKVNVVLLRGVNDDEILDFAAFARDTGRIVRFIEFMPLDYEGQWDRDQLVPGHEVVETISRAWPLEAIDGPVEAPSERFRFTDGTGEIGVISSVTEPFCGTCNRLRLTSDGQIRNCLFSDEEQSVREIMRGGGSDADIERVIRRSVWAKFPGHAINEPSFLRPRRSMSMIGG
jgi:cyclic pyranopterin phosphate synthase